jgi:hypothetical protein
MIRICGFPFVEIVDRYTPLGHGGGAGLHLQHRTRAGGGEGGGGESATPMQEECRQREGGEIHQLL